MPTVTHTFLGAGLLLHAAVVTATAANPMGAASAFAAKGLTFAVAAPNGGPPSGVAHSWPRAIQGLSGVAHGGCLGGCLGGGHVAVGTVVAVGLGPLKVGHLLASVAPHAARANVAKPGV